MSNGEKEPDRSLGLCLGGGGGLGLLHIGLLEAMEDLGIRPGIIAGCSSGSFVGALYAAGKSSREIREILGEFRWWKIVAPAIPLRGFLSTRRMQSFFKKHLGDIDIADLPIPLKIAAVDLLKGELAAFTKGPLVRCLAAGAAVPGIFEPVRVREGTYYDAGGIYNLPLELLSGEGVKRIIAGNTIGEKSLMKHPRTVQDVIYQAYLIRTKNLTRWRLGPSGWEGKRGEEVVLVDYDTGGASPAGLEECRAMIEDTRSLALKVLRKAFG